MCQYLPIARYVMLVPLLIYSFESSDEGLQKFDKTTMDTLNSFAPIKKNARGND